LAVVLGFLGQSEGQPAPPSQKRVGQPPSPDPHRTSTHPSGSLGAWKPRGGHHGPRQRHWVAPRAISQSARFRHFLPPELRPLGGLGPKRSPNGPQNRFWREQKIRLRQSMPQTHWAHFGAFLFCIMMRRKMTSRKGFVFPLTSTPNDSEP
jgi:hypothetical protein